MYVRRDVRTGRFIGTTSMSRRGSGFRRGETWFEISLGSCPSNCPCDGFEVCLHRLSNGLHGGRSSSPLWPVLSLPSEEEATTWMKKLTAFAKGIDPKEDVFDQAFNGDGRLGRWLQENGFVKINHVLWGIPKS